MTNLRCLPKGLTPLARFELSWIPEPNSGCWLWLGRPRGSNGYGGFMMNERVYVAHRASWLLLRGEIPDGKLVLHHCDNPSCVNPHHLFLGTHQDNEDDKVRKGRQARGDKLAHPRAAGEANGNSKLTIQAVREIRAATVPQRSVAKAYGVTQALVSKIQRGEIWK
jgi:hypothetical protein